MDNKKNIGKSIDLSKTVYELCSNDPEIKNILSEIGFTEITNPKMLNTVGRFMTIPKGAALKKIDIEFIKQTFEYKGYKIKK